MNTGRRAAAAILAAIALAGSGCAASRSAVEGAYRPDAGDPPRAAPAAERVTVAFIFTLTNQNLGLDVVPKVRQPNRFVNGFYDFFADALPELSNLGAYATFTELLVFMHPFHPEERKTQEVYLEFLRDTFREIDADGLLAPR